MGTKLTVKLTGYLFGKLSEIAEQTERPKSFYIQNALELYLAEIADLQIAYDRLHDGSDPVFAIDDIRNDLGLLISDCVLELRISHRREAYRK